MIRECKYCGARKGRAHRTFFERLTSRAVYRCTRCGTRSGVHRSLIAFFHARCACPLCGNTDVNRLTSPHKADDKVEKMTSNPVRLLLGFVLRAPLYHCTVCHFQFYDLRHPETRPHHPKTLAADFRK